MTARLISTRELCPEVRHFVFEADGVSEFPFTAGQFVSFSAQINGKTIVRPYSIASAPNGGNRFDLCLNRVQDGLISPLLFDMAPGGTIEMTPPLGFFTLRSLDREAVFVATGTGIAPFRSLVHAHLEKLSRPLTLIFGVRYESHLMYRPEFEELASRYPHFRFLPVLSRPPEGWTGAAGHVQPHLIASIGGRRDLDVYICGLKLMVDDVRGLLKGLGFDRRQIVFEKYD